MESKENTTKKSSGSKKDKQVKPPVKQKFIEPALAEDDDKHRNPLGKYNLRKKPAISTKFEDM